LEPLEDRVVLDFAPNSFIKTPFPSHAVPLAEHFHPHLHIFIDGIEHVIPGDTNIVEPTDPIVAQGVSPGLYPIHVHIQDLELTPPDTGKLHVESTLPYDFHLSDFFTIWTYTSGSEKILNGHEIKLVDSNGENVDFKADATHTITMTVDGAPNSEFGHFVLSDPHSPLPDNPGPNIVVTGTTLSQPPPPSPPGPPVQGTPNQMLVTQFYHDCLGRSPDPQGLAHFSGLLDQGMASRQAVALTIQTSPEARTRQVEMLYQKYLGRQADHVGLDLSTRFLNSGGSFLKLESVICGSPEYYDLNGSSDGSYLAAVYRDALARAVDPVGQSLGGHALSLGMDRGKLAEVVFTSNEGLQDLLQGYYNHLLNRTADGIGLELAGKALQLHLEQLGMLPKEGRLLPTDGKVGATEDDLITVIMASDEYYRPMRAV
jgi:hypothetical protein